MKTKRSAASSQPEKLIRKSEADIRAYINSPKFQADAERSRARGPEPTAKDLEEIPALTDAQLSSMYRPIKSPVTVRLDADVLSWLKSKGGRYQTHMNAALRKVMKQELAR